MASNANCLLVTVNVHASEEETDFNSGCVWAVRAVHGVGIDAVSKVSADGAWCSVFGVGSAHQVTVFQNRAFAFEYLDHDRARDHEVNQIFEERTRFVDRVKLFSFTA